MNKPDSKPSFRFRAGVGGLALLLIAFLSLPILTLIGRGLSGGLPAPDRLFGPGLWAAVTISLITSAFSQLVILALGTPLAFMLARFEFPFKPVIGLLVELPIVMPPVVAGLALLMAFGRRGLFGFAFQAFDVTITFTPIAVIMAQVFVSAPYYIRAAQVRFESIPPELEEAAAIDGASQWGLLRDVILPLSWQGMVIGLLLSWARALGEFGATILFAGNLSGSTQTMPLLVYTAFERDLESAIWTAIILIGVAVLSLSAARWLLGQTGQPAVDLPASIHE